MSFSEAQIWEFIESTRPKKRYEVVKHVEALQALVSRMSQDEIVYFTEAFEEIVQNARTYPLFLAFNLMCQGHCTDDVLDDAISSLIFRGKQSFEVVVRSPDSLAELDDLEICEEASLFLDELWEELYTGTLIPTAVPEGPYIRNSPSSQAEEEAIWKTLPQMYPKLYAKYGAPATPLR
ncbi:MAG TPA: DUF4240 domain-containing protein [Candidatus Obscuribacter sp.]|nr:DUF4240 domain-containing protein [Candidatus Obscuribacter sp.]HNB16321.1 DUF4240 domain-containing protein [Candidatus Obscuribacter sp.]HNG22069.1 DUF4240 domain-containing protein [Candidatus Obscuribacter sp.]